MNPIPPGLPVETYEIPTGPPLPLPEPGAPPLPPPPNWVEQRQAEMAQQEALRVDAELAAQTAADAEAAEKEALRQKHGVIPSASGAFLRGALDALLVGPSGAAVSIESTGEALNSKTLKDFGRGLGKAATGKSALESLAFVFGGGGKEGAEYADISNRLLREQEAARPTLTTVSRLAGTAAIGLGIGVAAQAPSAAAMLGVNTLEGAAAGAQQAYDQSAPLRDVLTSAAIGAAVGGAVTGAAEGISYVAKHADLSRVFGGVQRQADKMAVEAVTGKAAAELGDEGVIARIARRTRELVGKGPDEIAPVLDAKAAEAFAGELSLVRAFDDEVPGAMGKIDGLIASYRRSGVPGMAAVGDELELAAAKLRAKLTTQVADAAFETATGMPLMRTVQRNPTLSDLVTFRRELGPLTKVGKGVVEPIADATRSLGGLVTKELEAAASTRGPAYARLWKETTQAADDLQLVARTIERDVAARAAKPLVSGSEARSAVVGALIAGVSAANPMAAIAGAIGGKVIHKGANKIGGAALNALKNRFARMGPRVSIRAAGGREMAEVLTTLAKAKAFAAEAAQAAGQSPALRQQAENLALDIASEAIEGKVGRFVPELWHESPISPLQKVMYRSQILDKVAEDVAIVAERTRALQPKIPDVLDVARVGKLTKGVDGPAAIGGLRGKVDELLSSVPPTPTGEAMAVAMRKEATMIERADVPTAMARGHDLANLLDESAARAGDEGSAVFLANAAREIRNQLGSDAFGAAGKEYRALTTPVSALDGFSNAGKVREALAGIEKNGSLPTALRSAQEQIARAHEAAGKLTGAPRDKSIAKAFAAGEEIFRAAEDVLTIDGAAAANVFAMARRVGLHTEAGLGKAVQKTTAEEAIKYPLETMANEAAHEQLVADTVDGEMDNLVPVLRDAASGGSPKKYRPGAAAAAAASMPLTIEEERDRYKERLDTLTRMQSGAEDMGSLGEHPIVAADANDKMAALLRDMPKPPSTPLGPMGPDALSADDLRLANAMWEATTEPLSVVRDLASGYIDPDKAAYAWKQYPGLQKACQANVVDVLSQDLDDEERASIPENILAQLDATFGFGGRLQETSDPFFAGRMSEIFLAEQQKQPKPAPGVTIKLPAADPTFTARIAGQA